MTRVWRKRLKKTGLVLTIMMLGLWVFSVMFAASYAPPSNQWHLGMGNGRIGFLDSPLISPGWSCESQYAYVKSTAMQSKWIDFAYSCLGYDLPRKDGAGDPFVPVWLLVAAVGFPTAILRWRDRRPKAGCCTVCKYDLTGNISGTCPECGTAVDRCERGTMPPRDGV